VESSHKIGKTAQNAGRPAGISGHVLHQHNSVNVINKSTLQQETELSPTGCTEHHNSPSD